ncbi:hypothetical protein HMI54_015577, partial [Coelomomyces lativittatus]
MSSLPQESRPNSGMSISKGVPVELSRTTFPVPPLPKPIPTQKHHEIEMMYFTPLGAGSEVGRSCHILKFKGKFIMLDCGAHPAYNGLGALPFFDEIEPEQVDLVLITHFHIDHCASLPYFMQKTNFKGRVYMTHPTKAIFKWMLSDYVRISSTSADDMPYNEQDLQNAYDRIEAIDFHQVVEMAGIRFSALNAGHVLGAAMFLIEIAGVKILYTGDYSREEDRHLNMADVPSEPIDVLVCEATYGVQNHTPRIQRETRFTQLVHQIVTRGGRCLVPMFALGRAQELLLILDEYWEQHPELNHIPIYYASNLARKCMAVYQTYISMMNQKIRDQFVVKNPFIFKHIANLRSMTNFDDVGPCVMLASPAMLQSGLSRELLEMWCPDKKNGVIIPGYVVEGTLGKQLLSEPNEITSSTGAKLPVRCSIDYISFSAHVDFTQNREFIENVNPNHLILVHGETNMVNRLKTALLGLWGDRDTTTLIHAPKNAESVALHFKGEKYAKALGSLAHLKDGQVVQGILVSKDFEYHLVTVQEVTEFTDLPVSLIRQKQYVPLETGTWDLVLFHLHLVYPEHLVVEHNVVTVYDKIKVTYTGKRELIVEWDGHPIDDVLADSVLAVLLHVESSPVSVK